MTLLKRPGFRRWSWLIIVALVAVSLLRNAVDGGGPETTEERVREIASTMKCPVCRSQSVADSDVAAARSIRNEITRRVEQGESADEIRDAISATYGSDLQLTPPKDGFAGLVWIVPVVALVLALATLGAAFRRWRRTAPDETSDDDRDLVERALRDR